MYKKPKDILYTIDTRVGNGHVYIQSMASISLGHLIIIMYTYLVYSF